MFKSPTCVTASYLPSSRHLNCCVRAEWRPPALLARSRGLAVCLPPVLYIKTRVCSSLPLVSRGPSLSASAACFSVIAIFMRSGGAPCVPCSPSPRFWRGLCHHTHTPCPQRSIQVSDLLTVSLRAACVRWRWRTRVWQNDTSHAPM